MKYLFIILALSLLLTNSSFADVKASELNGFDIMSLNGTYMSESGDKVEVTVKPVENIQGELFGPSEYTVTAILTVNGMKETYNVYELNTYGFSTRGHPIYEINPEKGQFTLNSQTECEDPGCEWSEISLTFTKNKNGTVEVVYDFTYGVEVNDYFSSENLPSSLELTDFCHENFGSITEGNLENEGYFYCEAFAAGTMK